MLGFRMEIGTPSEKSEVHLKYASLLPTGQGLIAT